MLPLNWKCINLIFWKISCFVYVFRCFKNTPSSDVTESPLTALPCSIYFHPNPNPNPSVREWLNGLDWRDMEAILCQPIFSHYFTSPPKCMKRNRLSSNGTVACFTSSLRLQLWAALHILLYVSMWKITNSLSNFEKLLQFHPSTTKYFQCQIFITN